MQLLSPPVTLFDLRPLILPRSHSRAMCLRGVLLAHLVDARANIKTPSAVLSEPPEGNKAEELEEVPQAVVLLISALIHLA